MYPPDKSSETDKELIKKAKKKDKHAFSLLINRYSDKIFGYLTRYVGDYHRAEDLTIETFLNAYERMRTYKEMGKFSSWLYMIATNCAKKELQRRKRLKEVPLEKPIDKDGQISLKDLLADDRSRPDYNAREKELKELIYNTISEMDKKYKDVLLLCDVEGLAYDDVAKVLKCNVVTVGTRVRRARKALYKLLRRYGYKF